MATIQVGPKVRVPSPERASAEAQAIARARQLEACALQMERLLRQLRDGLTIGQMVARTNLEEVTIRAVLSVYKARFARKGSNLWIVAPASCDESCTGD